MLLTYVKSNIPQLVWKITYYFAKLIYEVAIKIKFIFTHKS